MATIKNLEHAIHERVITQIKGIDGTSDYNYTILSSYVYDEFKFPEKMVGSPSVCFGDWVNARTNTMIRKHFQVPFTWTVWGYVKERSNTLDKALKLLSDFRIALGSDEHLNSLITEFSCLGEVSAYDGVGVVRFELSGVLDYDLT